PRGEGRRHHRAARHLSGLDRRQCAGRYVPPPVRLQADEQGRGREPDDEAAGREDRQPCRAGAVSAAAMMQGGANWRARTSCAALALTALLAAGPAAQAQNYIHTPNLNIETRAPQINPNVARPAPNIVARVPTPTIAPRVVNPNMPYLHYSPNLYPSCG